MAFLILGISLVVLFIIINLVVIVIRSPEIWIKEKSRKYTKTLNKWIHIINPFNERVIRFDWSSKNIVISKLELITNDQIKITLDAKINLDIIIPSRYYYSSLKSDHLQIISDLFVDIIKHLVSIENILNVNLLIEEFKTVIIEKLKEKILKAWFQISNIELNFNTPEDIKNTINFNKNVITEFFDKIDKSASEFNEFTLHLSLWDYLSKIHSDVELIKDNEIEELFAKILSKDFDKWWIVLNNLSLTKNIDFKIQNILDKYKKDLISKMDMRWMELTEHVDDSLINKIKKHCFELYIDLEPLLKSLYSSIRLWNTEANDLFKHILNKEIKKYWISINNIEVMKKDMNLKIDDIIANLNK